MVLVSGNEEERQKETQGGMHGGDTRTKPRSRAGVRGQSQAGDWRRGLLQQFDITHNQVLPVNKNHSTLLFCQQLRLHQGFLKDLQMQKTKQFRKQTVSFKLKRTHTPICSEPREGPRHLQLWLGGPEVAEFLKQVALPLPGGMGGWWVPIRSTLLFYKEAH